MVKKICIFLLLILTTFFVLPTSEGYALSRSEKQSKCAVLKAKAKPTFQDVSLKGSIIPISLLNNFSNSVQNISDNLISIQVLGDTLMCHAVYGDPWEATVLGIHLFDWANIPIWLCGAIVYCFGFMLVLSVTFYIVDVSFKLGFSIIVLPIAIALWPFSWTKDKLMVCISVFLKSAGILVFLSITTAYALNMLIEALGALPPIMDALTHNKTTFVSETFSLTSGTFLLIVVVLIYGMKMIGSTIPDYVDKFFPDQMFGKGSKASPMHMLSTQGVDFVKQKAVAPVAAYTRDVVNNLGGHVVSGTGKLIQGKYHNQIKSGIHQAGVAIRNPKETSKKALANLRSGGASVEKYFKQRGNNIKFGLKSTLGSAILSGEGREAFQAHVAEQKNAANETVAQQAQTKKENYQNNIDNINAQIRQNEAQRNANPSALRQAINNSGVLDIPQKAAEWHAQNQQEANEKLEILKDSLDRKLLKKGPLNDLNQKINNKAEEIKQAFSENKLAKWRHKSSEKLSNMLEGRTQKIANWANRNVDRINNGKLAEKSEDGWVNWAQKRIRRNIATSFYRTASKVASVASTTHLKIANAALKTPDIIVNGAINASSKALQNGVDLRESVRNGYRRTKFVVKNVLDYGEAYTQKYGDKFLKGVGNVWKVPGKILEGTGDAMQNNKPKANEEYLRQKEWADWEEKKEKEESQE